jgi:hypothetical protein
MIALLAFFVSSYGIGRFTLWKTGVSFSGVLENTVFSVGIGFGCWCYLLFLLGHAGLLYPGVFVVLALSSAIPATIWIFKNAPRTRFHLPKITLRFVDSVAIASAFFILAITLICCFSPVVGGIANDEIATHLSAPKQWLALHKITALADPSSAIAGHVELLFLWAMAFMPQAGPKLLTWTSFLLCLALTFAFARRVLGRRPALYACIFTAINPLIFRESCTAFTDLFAAFFVLAALGSLWRMKESNDKKFLVAAAFFAGVGCGAKPTVYFFLPAFFAVSCGVALALREHGRGLIKSMAILLLLVSVFAAPWPVRNMVLSGSPTFPPPQFLYALHGHKPFVFSGTPFSEKDARALYDYYRSRTWRYGTGVKNFFLLPWNITMHPESLSIGDSVGAVMLSLLPIVFFIRKRPSWLNTALFFCGIAAACIYFFIIPEARYFIAVFMLLSIVFAWLVKTLNGSPGVIPIVNLVIVVNCLFSCAIGARIFHNAAKAALFSDYRETYKKNNVPFYEAFEYCNREKPQPLFVLYENQVFYYLTTGYRCDGKILEHAREHFNGYVLDVDYSQTMGRNLDKQTSAYGVGMPPPNFQLVFTGPDARVYKIVN